VDSFTELAREFGIAAAVLVFVGIGAAWVLRRLFAKDGGILTKVGERHVDFIDGIETTHSSLARSIDRLAATAEDAHSGMRDRNESLAELAGSRAGLHRAAVHACDILAKITGNLGLGDETKDSIEAIRREVTK